MADPVHHRDIDAISDSVRALDRPPGVMLRGSILFLLRWMPADRGRVEQYLCAGECCKTRTLGIPLVPADECADAPEVCVESPEAEIAGSEVKLFVVERI